MQPLPLANDNNSHGPPPPRTRDHAGKWITESDYSYIVSILHKSLIPDEHRVQAEADVFQASLRHGYVSMLWQILHNQHEKHTVRMLAATEFKNAVVRYWNPVKEMNHFAISEQEKSRLRPHLLSIIHSISDEVMFKLLSVSIVSIAKGDRACSWQQLILELLDMLDKDASVHLKVLMLFNQLYRQLTSKLVVRSSERSRPTVDEFSRDLRQLSTTRVLPFLTHFFQFYLRAFFNELSSVTPSISEDHSLFSIARILSNCIKILHRLVIRCCDESNTSQMDELFLKTLLTFSKDVAKYHHDLPVGHYPLKFVMERLLYVSMKPILRILVVPALQRRYSKHVIDFSSFCLYEILRYDPHSTAHSPKMDAFIVRCMCILNDLFLLCDPKVYMHLFSHDVIASFLEKLILCYMKISQAACSTIDDLPEEYITSLWEDDWTGSLKTTAETIYLQALDVFPNASSFVQHFIERLLNETYEQSMNMSNPDACQHAMLTRAACYNAMGWSWTALNLNLKFKDWYMNQLRHELSFSHSHRVHLVIQIKILWLCGKWVNDFDQECRQDLYDRCVSLMGSSSLALVLSCVFTLNDFIHDQQFVSSDFHHAHAFLEHLLLLLPRVHDESCLLKMLSLLGNVLKKMNHAMDPFMSAFLSFFEKLWYINRSMLIKRSIVEITSIWLQALSDTSVLHDLIIMMVSFAAREEVYLMEVGLELWQSALHCSSLLTPGLSSLFSILSSSLPSTYHEKVLKILYSYLLLGGFPFIEHHLSDIASLLLFILKSNSLDPPHYLSLSHIVESCLLVNANPSLCIHALSDFFRHVVLLMLNDRLPSSVLPFFFTMFARLLFVSPESFLFVFQSIDSVHFEPAVVRFLRSWLSVVHDVSNSHHLKLHALAFISLFSLSLPSTFSFFVSILSFLVSVLSDIEQSNPVVMIGMGNHIISAPPFDMSSITGKNEFERKQLLLSCDPIFHVSSSSLLHSISSFVSSFSSSHPSIFSSTPSSLLDSLHRLGSSISSSSSSSSKDSSSSSSLPPPPPRDSSVLSPSF